MKVLAINGSPRGPRGNTDRILRPFLEGAREAGAQTETIYLKDKHIEHCTGCFTCWTKTPGVCIHKDDMPEILEKVREADMVVFATPLYVFTVSGLMKDFMDRLIPLVQPFILERGGHFIHPPRHPEAWPKKMVLISNCGFPQRHHFSALEETFRRFADTPDIELAGVILCAGGELLRVKALEGRFDWYLNAARKAGREVIEQGRISPETQAVLDRPLVENPAVYARMANMYWQSLGVEPIAPTPRSESHPSPKEKRDEGRPLPLPRSQETVRDIIAGMPLAFNPEAAGDLEAVVQFRVTGEEPGDYYLRIADGECRAYEGVHPSPTLTIHTPSEVWVAIARGELDGAQAMLEGKYHIEGDLGLLMRFDEIFSSAGKPLEKSAAPPPAPEETEERGPLKLGMGWLAVAFVPWMLNWIAGSIPGVPVWVSLGLPFVLGAALWLYRRLFARPTWFETGTPVYFGLAWLASLMGLEFFRTYGDVVGYIVLAGLWMGTLATETPLTAEYSKWSYHPALWRHPFFLRTNAVITAFWGGVYLLQAVLALLGHSEPGWSVPLLVLRNLLLIPAFAFTAWFPKWYPVRLAMKAKEPLR